MEGFLRNFPSCTIIIKLILAVATVYNNCRKRLLFDWTMWEAYTTNGKSVIMNNDTKPPYCTKFSKQPHGKLQWPKKTTTLGFHCAWNGACWGRWLLGGIFDKMNVALGFTSCCDFSLSTCAPTSAVFFTQYLELRSFNIIKNINLILPWQLFKSFES